MADTVHKFEKAGLGKAPFKLIAVQSLPSPSLCEANPTAYNMQMQSLRHSSNGSVGGTCDFCGMAIMNCYLIRSSDGNEFWVGCECVRKTGDSGLTKVVDREKARLMTDARHAREASKIDELRSILNSKENQDYFDTLPHPKGFSGKTFMDYADWMYRNSGASGKQKLLKQIQAVLAGETKDDDQDALADRCDGRQMMKLGR